MISRPPAGSPHPVFIGGIRYRSIFEAALEVEISSVWILNRLKASAGFPVIIKGQAVVEESWVDGRLSACGGLNER
jgi:hypothetical protein